MAQVDTLQPSMTFRGTVDEVFSRRSEIPTNATVELNVFEPQLFKNDDPTVALLESWIASAPTEPSEVRAAEADLQEFKRNMNLARREIGARLHYPDVA